MDIGAGVAMGNLMMNQMAKMNAGNQASSGGAESKEDIMGLLKQLGELKEAGILTEEEFSAKKAELLARL